MSTIKATGLKQLLCFSRAIVSDYLSFNSITVMVYIESGWISELYTKHNYETSSFAAIYIVLLLYLASYYI